MRSALSPKDEQKTATSFTKSESIQQQLFSFVDCFIDLSKKYGLGYLINNNTYGILFNDGSVISSDEKKRYSFFLDLGQSSSLEIQKRIQIPLKNIEQKICQKTEIFKKSTFFLIALLVC